MKKHKPEELISTYQAEIKKSIDRWNYINEYGCNDPFWPDGCNMNLVHNHVIHFKKLICELCQETGLPLPEEYYYPTPPEVDDHYMAAPSLRQKARMERLKYDDITTRKAVYKGVQMELF